MHYDLTAGIIDYKKILDFVFSNQIFGHFVFEHWTNNLISKRYFEDILKMLLGEAVFALDKLPLVQDERLIKNILCAGLWSQFNKKFGKGKESADVSGPV